MFNRCNRKRKNSQVSQHLIRLPKCALFILLYFILEFLQKETILVQYERCESDLRNTKLYREDENRKYGHELERLNSEIATLKSTEINLIKNIEELKENLLATNNERDEVREQNESQQNEIENIQKMLYDETESASKAASKIVLLTRQLDEEQRRAVEALHQVDDLRMQLKSALMNNETLKSELHQARSLIQEQSIKVCDLLIERE